MGGMTEAIMTKTEKRRREREGGACWEIGVQVFTSGVGNVLLRKLAK